MQKRCADAIRSSTMASLMLSTSITTSHGWQISRGHNGTHADLAEYLLGKKVLKLESAVDSGASVPWDVVLRYEFKLRKFAVDMVKDGSTYTQGFRAAISDTETRTLHFTEALKFSRKRGRNADNDDKKHRLYE